MMKLSKKTEYAVIALMDMVENGAEVRTTAKDLSEKYNIPRDLLGKVLQSLAREGVIVSHQGVKGGYRLNCLPEQVNLQTVISAVEGPIQLVDCGYHDHHDCEQLQYCNIRNPMEFIQNELTRFFNRITLADVKHRMAGVMPLLQIQNPSLKSRWVALEGSGEQRVKQDKIN